MNRVHPLPYLAVSLGVLSLLAAPATAFTQTFYGLSVGRNYFGPAPWGDSFTHGLTAQACLGRQLGRGLSVRLDAFRSLFHETETSGFHCDCSGVPPCCSLGKPVGVVGFAANAMMNLGRPAGKVGLYVIAGAGAYHLYQAGANRVFPDNSGVQPDLSAGAGASVRVAKRSLLFVEARYTDLLGTSSSPYYRPGWLVPVTFGLRF